MPNTPLSNIPVFVDPAALAAYLEQYTIQIREEQEKLERRPPTMWTLKETTDKTGLTYRTLKAHIAAGHLHPLQIGSKRVLLRADEVIQLMERGGRL